MPKKDPQTGYTLISVAEMLHATIPAPGKAMKEIHEMGDEGFVNPSPALEYLTNLIVSQAENGADYIDINVDALGGDAAEAMRRYARLVHEHGKGVPACFDSSNVDVLMAGLETWYELGDVPAPLLNSVPYNEIERFKPIFEARAKHEFSVVCMLVGPEGPMKSADEIYEKAKEMFGIAKAAGFKSGQICFDTVTLGIASDSCVDGMGEIKPSHTHNSFMAMRKIRQDAEMAGVHIIQGVSNWVYGATKRRIGHLRAYIAVGQKYGLDAAICDVEKQFGIQSAPPELMEFVETYVSLDGSMESMMTYSAAMQQARESEWI